MPGEKFEELYTRYEKEGRAKRTVKAQALWYAIIESQVSIKLCHEKEIDADINLIINYHYHIILLAFTILNANMNHDFLKFVIMSQYI